MSKNKHLNSHLVDGEIDRAGETERQLEDRIKEHSRDDRQLKDKPIIYHFRDTHCERDLRFGVLAKLLNGK